MLRTLASDLTSCRSNVQIPVSDSRLESMDAPTQRAVLQAVVEGAPSEEQSEVIKHTMLPSHAERTKPHRDGNASSGSCKNSSGLHPGPLARCRKCACIKCWDAKDKQAKKRRDLTTKLVKVEEHETQGARTPSVSGVESPSYLQSLLKIGCREESGLL